jgi:ribosome-associated protein
MEIPITDDIAIDEKEIHVEFIRASGPGGQNVNKVATAVQLRFDVRHSPTLPDDVRARLIALAGRRINADGVLIIEARKYRAQEQNRAEAQARLIELIRQAAEPLQVRRKTKLPRIAKAKRLEFKRRRSEIKTLRRTIPKE